MNEYEDIVNSRDRPHLVLAGPGAGKTWMLADRIKRLLDDEIPKDRITALTFGIDAKFQLIRKLTDPTGDFNIDSAELPNIATMHSLGLHIVQDNARAVKLKKKDLKTQSDERAKKLLYRDAALMLGFTEIDSLEAAKCKAQKECEIDDDSKFCSICANYREIMAKCNYIDYDDQVHYAVKILGYKPDVLSEYQQRSTHLLVDEYQDINAAQFRLIELLTRSNPQGLFAVGDDAQSIYGFRGGDPRFILRFKEDFPEAKVSPLRQSRRCPECVMSDAQNVLKNHYPNWSGKQDLQYHQEVDEIPEIIHVPSEKAEAQVTAMFTRKAVEAKQDVLILLPKKEFFSGIARALSSSHLPFSSTINLIPDRMAVAKLFIDWLANPNDSFLTRRAIEEMIDHGTAKVPGAKKTKKTSKSTISKRISEETAIANLWKAVSKTENLYEILIKAEPETTTIESIQESFKQLKEKYEDTSKKHQGEFVKILARISGLWIKPAHLAKDITDVIELLRGGEGHGGGSVQIMTMRKAKGLEADVVLMVGLEDDIIPSNIGDIEEAARLFYVSMTRAKKKLYLIHSHKRPRNISYGQDLFEKKRSCFLDALGRESKWLALRSKKKRN